MSDINGYTHRLMRLGDKIKLPLPHGEVVIVTVTDLTENSVYLDGERMGIRRGNEYDLATDDRTFVR